MTLKQCLLILLPLILLYLSQTYSCTTAIVTGKATPDGRPLLWKHRDSDFIQNKMMFFEDGQLNYIGLVNGVDSTGAEVWAGCNSAGFAIMNAASYNLNINDTTGIKDREGILMKAALQVCTTLHDFENLLDSLPKPLGVEANFGAIDASGGAAYYETGNFEFRKVDVNDLRLAPSGYLIRTNYSFTGKMNQGYGYIRYNTALELFDFASATNNLTAPFILQQVSRSLKHSLTQVDLAKLPYPSKLNPPELVFFIDFIPRFSSTSSIVVQGVQPVDSPDLTTLWTLLGFPLGSVMIPIWVQGGMRLPKVLTDDGTGKALLCEMSLQLKKCYFPVKRGSGKNYLNRAALFNQEQNGILQKIESLEKRILKRTQQLLRQQNNKKLNTAAIQNFYDWIDQTIISEYGELMKLYLAP